MNSTRKAYFIGGGIGSLAGAAFLIRDGGMPGANIRILEAGRLMGGSLDGTGDAERGYSMRGGRMLTTDNYECTWELFKSIPSITRPGLSVFDETMEFNEAHVSKAMARLVDGRRAKVPVASMGFSMHDRLELLKLANADESTLGASCITDHLSPAFFQTEFWFMWVTTFAFQPWHSAVEFRRYLHRFMLEFSRIETLAGVKRTVLNQYDSLVVPLLRWLEAQGVHLVNDCTVTDIDAREESGRLEIFSLSCEDKNVGRDQVMTMLSVKDELVFLQNGSMTDASSLGSMSTAPAKLKKSHKSSWTLWEKLAKGRPALGRPEAFNSCVAQSDWASFTVTLKDPAFFDQMQRFTGNEAGTGGLVTFKDSNWLMSIVLAHQPHFANQPADVQVFWGYGLFPDRIGNFVAKAMADCTGAELLQELCGHLRFDPETVASANCIPCRMPYITSMFMPRAAGDRPLPVPEDTANFAFISQFVEIPLDTVFTVEFSVRAAQMAVYQLLGITKPIPAVSAHDKSLHAQFEALVKALK
ncbi:oleate hydratase [Paucibacter sp. DJ1R-11]|uniref:oleate hydratase n=1 Tax=Paucibacter sp. DJ1R-11 TaxID=2893556 RepID=UPI0021E4CD2E|nr:oleate hydratase [Paucibacter sp. DJ1R-11]MCV2364401.1 oleate hydratase [Paucibacter sp. DJ1R-11]